MCTRTNFNSYSAYHKIYKPYCWLEIICVFNAIRGSIGGQETWRTFLTLPNIIKEFNPRLIGHSLTDSFTHQNESQFNVAEIGAMSQDLPFMTRQLVKRIKKDSRVDFKNDWKVLALLILVFPVLSY